MAKNQPYELSNNMLINIGLFLCVLCLLSGGCQYINKKIGLQDDHLLEQMAEEYIRQETGFDVDLTPDL